MFGPAFADGGGAHGPDAGYPFEITTATLEHLKGPFAKVLDECGGVMGPQPLDAGARKIAFDGRQTVGRGGQRRGQAHLQAEAGIALPDALYVVASSGARGTQSSHCHEPHIICGVGPHHVHHGVAGFFVGVGHAIDGEFAAEGVALAGLGGQAGRRAGAVCLFRRHNNCHCL